MIRSSRSLRAAKLITDADYRARYALAIEEREFTRARWLARSLDDDDAPEASRALAADPDQTRNTFVTTHAKRARITTWRDSNSHMPSNASHSTDPQRALELWQQIENRLFVITGAPARHPPSHRSCGPRATVCRALTRLLTGLPLAETRRRSHALAGYEPACARSGGQTLLNDIAMMTIS